MGSLAYEYNDFWGRLSTIEGFCSGGSSVKKCGFIQKWHYNFLPHAITTLIRRYLRFKRISIANLKVNVNKCAFSFEEVMVKGFKVQKDIINPNPAKVQDNNELQPFKNVSGVNQIWNA